MSEVVMSNQEKRYLHYSPSVETLEANEHVIFDELSRTMQHITRTMASQYRHAYRPVHAKSHGVLVASTWSGAEQSSYYLKMLKRATLVGETKHGCAHAGVFHRIDDHFSMGIPEERPINPYGETDWEGVGVLPDMKVKAVDALDTAVKLADARLQSKKY